MACLTLGQIKTEQLRPVSDYRGRHDNIKTTVHSQVLGRSPTHLCSFAPFPLFTAPYHRHRSCTNHQRPPPSPGQQISTQPASAAATPFRPHVAIPLCRPGHARPGRSGSPYCLPGLAWPGLAASKTTATRLRPSRSPNYGQDSPPSWRPPPPSSPLTCIG